MDLKDVKPFHITFLKELPPKDSKPEIGAGILVPVENVPGEDPIQLNLYSWIDDDWVFLSTIDLADFNLNDLKEACDDLENAIKKLNKAISRTKDDERYDELSSKLSKITSKIVQAKYELTDDVIASFENS